MSLPQSSIVRWLSEAGPDDRVFDLLLAIGPLLVLLIAVTGRSLITVGIAVLYIGFFIAYILYKSLR
nr:hypothetical protein [Natronococcus sp. AD5]